VNKEAMLNSFGSNRSTKAKDLKTWGKPAISLAAPDVVGFYLVITDMMQNPNNNAKARNPTTTPPTSHFMIVLITGRCEPFRIQSFL
jgi:hypothetical protein